MFLNEKCAWITLWGFSIAAVISILIIIGNVPFLNWESKHIYFACFSVQGIAHLAWIIPCIILSRKAKKMGDLTNKHSQKILHKANSIATRLCCSIFFIGIMISAIIGIYLPDGYVKSTLLFLMVLIASFAFMFTQSVASLYFYRKERLSPEEYCIGSKSTSY